MKPVLYMPLLALCLLAQVAGLGALEVEGNLGRLDTEQSLGLLLYQVRGEVVPERVGWNLFGSIDPVIREDVLHVLTVPDNKVYLPNAFALLAFCGQPGDAAAVEQAMAQALVPEMGNVDREVVKWGVMCLAAIKARHPDQPSPVLDAMGTWKYWQGKEYGWSSFLSDNLNKGPLIPLCQLAIAYNFLGDDGSRDAVVAEVTKHGTKDDEKAYLASVSTSAVFGDMRVGFERQFGEPLPETMAAHLAGLAAQLTGKGLRRMEEEPADPAGDPHKR